MEKKALFGIIGILDLIFIVLTVFIFVIGNAKGSLNSVLILAYLIFILVYLIFNTINIFRNLLKLRKINRRKRIIAFVTWFVSLYAVTIASNYFFKPSDNMFTGFSIPLGLALGIAFYDLMISKPKKD